MVITRTDNTATHIVNSTVNMMYIHSQWPAWHNNVVNVSTSLTQYIYRGYGM